jgi:FlaG/FlaF family flagellin (archaellin)
LLTDDSSEKMVRIGKRGKVNSSTARCRNNSSICRSNYYRCRNSSSNIIFNNCFNNKKASSPWIAWVLLMTFAVALSAFMYNFMIGYTKDTNENIKDIVYNTDECRQVSASIEDVCFDSTSQILNITLQNRNYIRLYKIDFRIFNGNVPIHTNNTEITLNTNRKKLISLNTGTSQTVTYVEVIPHVTKENKDIICSDKKIAERVTVC